MAGLLDFLDGDNNPVAGLLGGFAPPMDDMSGARRAPGTLPFTGPLPESGFGPPPMTSQAGGLGNWLGANSDLLLALGAGLASGKDWGDGLGKAGTLALRARQTNQQRQQQMQLAMARLLMRNGTARNVPVPSTSPGVSPP
jgi:hypothetical protein